ncbi:MAG: hypothetical protein WC673_03265 [Candidatus Paceibacterota bacterium]|jgi:hypothetical protein
MSQSFTIHDLPKVDWLREKLALILDVLILDVRYNVHMNIKMKNIISITEARSNIFDIAKKIQKQGNHYSIRKLV